MYPMIPKWQQSQCKCRWFNAPLSIPPAFDEHRPSQIRTRPVPMTEEEVREVRKRTGSSPYLEKKFVPVAHGRPRSQTRRKK